MTPATDPELSDTALATAWAMRGMGDALVAVGRAAEAIGTMAQKVAEALPGIAAVVHLFGDLAPAPVPFRAKTGRGGRRQRRRRPRSRA